MSGEQTILITGANRGIGFGLAREFVGRNWRVFATCRHPAEAASLRALGGGRKLEILTLEVRDRSSIAALAQEVASRTSGLDILVNNAGFHPKLGHEKLGQLNLDAIADTFAVNALGPMAVSQALLPLLRAGQRPRLVHISSGAGSLKGVTAQHDHAYSISKAALNMFMRRSAWDLPAMGITTVVFSPGWVKTDMGGPNAEVEFDDAVAALAKTIESLTPEHNGQWLDRFGQPSEYAW